jgi:hypothetical protein
MKQLTDSQVDALIRFLEYLKPDHYYFTDSWFSCPKAPGGCSNPDAGEECNCNADARSRIIDTVIDTLRGL